MPPTIINADCLDALRDLPDESVHAVVTDPPYGLSNTDPKHVAETVTKWAAGDREYIPAGKGFMNAPWDAFVPPVAVWDECLRVLKPGGHMLVFAGSRTADLMGLSIRLAGFDIRDSISWLYGSGFPKSHNVSKAIEKADTDAAREWEGWGTALKPGQEPILVARKPFKGTVASNVQEHGTGAINIDACRVKMSEEDQERARVPQPIQHNDARGIYQAGTGTGRNGEKFDPSKGRFPANVILDEYAAAELDQQSGYQKDNMRITPDPGKMQKGYSGGFRALEGARGYSGGGGASRYFYVAKAPQKERPNVNGVTHPTVKPLKLMEHLVKLVTPPGGVVLDPFAGSGTTIEAAISNGFEVIGIEREQDYLPLIQARIDRANKKGHSDK